MNDGCVGLAVPKQQFELPASGFIFTTVYSSFPLFMEDRTSLSFCICVPGALPEPCAKEVFISM